MAINNRLDWKIDYKARLKPVNIVGSTRRSYKPLTRQLSNRRIAVGCHNPYANDNWEYAGNLYMKVLPSPSQSLPFKEGLILQEIPLSLGKLKYIEFPDYGVYKSVLRRYMASLYRHLIYSRFLNKF